MRQAEHFADDEHWQWGRQVGDQVQVAPSGDSFEQLIDNRLDSWAHAIDSPRRERSIHQQPESGVPGRLGEQHHPRQHPAQWIVGFNGHVPRATHEPGVGEGGRDIRVSRHDPDLMLLVPVHRIAFSQRAVGGVRVPKEIRREEGWEGPLGHRRSMPGS